MKKFWLLDIDSGIIKKDLFSKTPRDAALKAATKDEVDIYLVEPESGKIHVFEGSKIPLSEKEKTSYTLDRNIVSKPVVRKLLYKNLNQTIDKNVVEDVSRVFKELMDSG